LETWIAWLILHLIVNNSALVDIILIAWWIVLAMILWPDWNVQCQHSNIVSYTSIRNNNNWIEIWWGVFKNFVKFAKIGFFALFIFAVYYVKIKVIRKIVYQSKTRRKFFVERIKRRKNPIKIIISIYNRTLDFELLLEC